MKILLNEPLTSNGTFLRSLYVPVLPDQDTLDFTKAKKAEIHGCGFNLNYLMVRTGLLNALYQIDEVESFIEQVSYVTRSYWSKTFG